MGFEIPWLHRVESLSLLLWDHAKEMLLSWYELQRTRRIGLSIRFVRYEIIYVRCSLRTSTRAQKSPTIWLSWTYVTIEIDETDKGNPACVGWNHPKYRSCPPNKKLTLMSQIKEFSKAKTIESRFTDLSWGFWSSIEGSKKAKYWCRSQMIN